MEWTYIVSVFGLVGTLLGIYNIIVSRKDKAIRDTKEDNFGLLNYKVDELRKDFSKFSDKFDKYENEIDARIEKAVNVHIQMYHNKG